LAHLVKAKYKPLAKIVADFIKGQLFCYSLKICEPEGILRYAQNDRRLDSRSGREWQNVFMF